MLTGGAGRNRRHRAAGVVSWAVSPGVLRGAGVALVSDSVGTLPQDHRVAASDLPLCGLARDVVRPEVGRVAERAVVARGTRERVVGLAVALRRRPAVQAHVPDGPRGSDGGAAGVDGCHRCAGRTCRGCRMRSATAAAAAAPGAPAAPARGSSAHGPHGPTGSRACGPTGAPGRGGVGRVRPACREQQGQSAERREQPTDGGARHAGLHAAVADDEVVLADEVQKLVPREDVEDGAGRGHQGCWRVRGQRGAVQACIRLAWPDNRA